MKAMFLAVLIAVSGILACSHMPSDGREASTGVVTEGKASQLAEKAFLDATSHQVSKYAIRPSPSNEREWLFRVQGMDEFARPGYHWLVQLDKNTRGTKIVSRE